MEVKLLDDLDKSAPYPRVCICPSFAMHRGYVLVPAFQEYEVMYQSNRSFNIPPPPGIPRAFDVFSCPGGGNLINLIFPGAGIWSLLIGGGEFDR